MIEFINIKVEGFCSLYKLDLSLRVPGFTLIKAPNGYGKSTLFSAIVWCIYGKNLKGSSDVNTWAKYRPKDYLGTKVELSFRADGKLCKITRCLNYKGDVNGSKGASRLVFQIEAEDVPEKSKTSIQDRITRVIGMSYNLFMNSVMFGQGMKRIIQESSTDQKRVFEELFNITYLNEAKVIAQNKLNNSLEKFKEINSKVEALVIEKNTLKSSLRGFKQAGNTRDKQIDNQISLLQKNIKVKQDKLQGVDLTKLEKDKESFVKEIQSIDNTISKTKDMKLKAEEAIDIPLKELIVDTIKLLKSKKYKSALSNLMDIQKNYELSENYSQKLDSLKEQRSKLESKKYQLSINIMGYTSLKKNIQSLLDRISECEKEKVNNEYSQEIAKCKKKLKELRSSIKQYQPQLKTFEKDTGIYKWAYSEAFGNNGIKAFIFQSSVKDINLTLASYASILGFLIQFEVDTSGSRKDFKAHIKMDGIEVQYEDLSGGQQQLVNLAMAFAMNQVVLSIRGVNITFLDEVFESLSEDNVEIVISLLRHIYKDRSLYLISHLSSIPLGNSRVIKVSRVKGLSYYE